MFRLFITASATFRPVAHTLSTRKANFQTRFGHRAADESQHRLKGTQRVVSPIDADRPVKRLTLTFNE